MEQNTRKKNKKRDIHKKELRIVFLCRSYSALTMLHDSVTIFVQWRDDEIRIEELRDRNERKSDVHAYNKEEKSKS